jgi:peptidyl-prolyl cis-trans isomerase C
MKANLVIISSVILAVLLFCLGCEPESKTTTPEPAQQAVAEQVEPAQPSQEVVDRTEPEVEMTMEQRQTEQAGEAGPAPAEAESAAEAPQPSPDDVIVTVNGTEITRGRVDELVQPRLEQVMKRSRRKPTDDYLADVKKRLSQQITQGLIIEALIDQQMKKHNIIVTEQQIDDYIAQMAAREDMTVDDLKALITGEGRDYEQWKQQMQFDKIIGVLTLAEMQGFGTVDVNEADALEFYQQDQERYQIPEQVRASHILISPDTSDPNIDPNAADAAALAKAQKLLEQLRAGADFAQLAKENSDCPSSANGGDLGFGRRQSWVAPFSDAAFALQVGQISDIVKTQFGYHIIKVTDRKEAGLIPFDDVKDDIVKSLRTRREADLSSKYVVSLRDNSEIVYAEGQEPEESTDASPR